MSEPTPRAGSDALPPFARSCESEEEVQKTTTRYEHEWNAGYVPAPWYYVGLMYAGEPLLASEPVCIPATPEAMHHVEATAHLAR